MTVSVSAIEFYVCRVPLTSAFVWARGSVTAVTNIVTVIYGEADGRPLSGIGESAPRGPALTGDISQGLPSALQFAGTRLLGSEIPTDSAEAALEWISGFTRRLKLPKPNNAPPDFKPFRGTFCGIEMALLDLAGKALGQRVAEMFGIERDAVSVTAATIAEDANRDQLAHRLRRLGNRFPVCRIKGAGGDGKADLHRITTLAEIGGELGLSQPIWIDINAAFSLETARQFIADVAKRASQGRLPRQIIIEQPVEKSDVKGLAELQVRADDAAAAYGGEIIIMADETVWDSQDLTALLDAGGCRALNVKMQKAGGLIESLKTARGFCAADPHHMIQLGGFPGAGDITGWAMINLCLALPRLDFFTPAPPLDVEVRFGTPRVRFVSEESNALETHSGPGLGVSIEPEAFRPLVIASHRMPEPANTNTAATSR